MAREWKMRRDALEAARSALQIAIACTDRLCRHREIAPALREAQIAVYLETAETQVDAALLCYLSAEDDHRAND